MTTLHFTTPSSAGITVEAALDQNIMQAARAAGVEGIESDMLGFVQGANEYSRLSCQIRVTQMLDGVQPTVVAR